MKAITLLLITCLAASAQSLDSLSARVSALETENERIKSELWRSHEKFRLGAIITGVGLALVTVDAIAGSQDVDNDGYPRTPTFTYIGSGLMLAGAIVMIESHRHVGLAGHTKKSKTWKPFKIQRKGKQNK